MYYPVFNIKKSNIARFILAITFLLFLVELNAQEKDTIITSNHISEVEIKDSLNTSKYLWKLLKEYNSTERPDTTLFYIIDFKTEVPDSNYFEQFKGIIAVEFKDNKSTSYVCEGLYRDSNIINTKEFIALRFEINSIFQKKSKISRYNKFKKNLEFKHNKAFDTFKVSKKNNEEYRNSVYIFDNNLLSSHEVISTISDVFMSYEIFFNYSKIKYDSSYIVNCKIVWKYKYRDINAIAFLYLEKTDNINYTKRHKIDVETPRYLYDYINDDK